MKKRILSVVLSALMLAAVSLGGLVLMTGTSTPAEAAPPCEAQCRTSFGSCKGTCSRPNVQCLVACETVLALCQANCGSTTQ